MSKTVGLSLSGGAIRGVAHIGVIKALEENDIRVDYVSGTSAGSLVGCLYAAGYSPDKILEVFQDTSLFNLFTVGLPKFGITDLSYVEKKVRELIPDNSFESLEKKFFASVTNLSTGENEIISEGELSQVVVASSSIPILFKAQQIGAHLYVDGGVLNNLPVEPLRPISDILIGVNVSPIRQTKSEDLDSLMEIGFRTLDLVTWNNVERRLSQCDVIIEPGAQGYGFFELNKAKEIYEVGYASACDQMEKLFKLLGDRGDYVPPVREQASPSPQPPLKESPLRRFWKKIRDFFRKLFN